MKLKNVSAAFALALMTAGSHAEPPRPMSTTPEFGKDLLVDVSNHIDSSKSTAPVGDVWQWRGYARIEGSPSTEKNRPFVATNPDRDEKSHQRWVAVNLQTGFEYTVDMPRALAHDLQKYAEQTGSNMGNIGTAKPVESNDVQIKGWSNGDDGRTRRFDNTTYPFRAQGQMGGGERSGCSGTLIARNIVLTAAHCIYDRKDAEFIALEHTRFRPGREGECTTAACEPYGGHNAIWYFTPERYRTEPTNPWPWDYGIMVLGTAPGDTTGWLGYYAMVDDALKDFCADHQFGDGRCFNRGYPACDLSGAPENCVQGWAYQDVDNCEIGSFGSKDGDGWNTRLTVNCDLSGGHSGGGLFTDIFGGNRKVVFGVASTQSCSTCNAQTEFPNAFRRITPEVLDAISYFKAAHP